MEHTRAPLNPIARRDKRLLCRLKFDFRGSSRWTTSFFLLFVLLPAQAVSHVLYGAIDAILTDPSNAAIVRATVIARHMGTNESRQTYTNTGGGYSFPNLQTGEYELRVSAPGFQTVTQTEVRVTVNSIVRVNTKLALGAVTDT